MMTFTSVRSTFYPWQVGVSEISGNTILAVDMHGDTTDNEAVISIHLASSQEG